MPASTNATFENIAGYPVSASDVIRIPLDENNGDQEILDTPGVGFKYRVVQLVATLALSNAAGDGDDTATAAFFSGTTALTGAMELAAGDAGASDWTSGSAPMVAVLVLPFNEIGWFETAENEKLKVTTANTAAGINGVLGYIKMPV